MEKLTKVLEFLRSLGLDIQFEYANDEDWSCKRKQKHKSKEAAEKSAASLFQRRKEKVEAYECRYCGGWHTGHGW